MSIQIKPSHDCAIVIEFDSLSIYLARIPDTEVANEIYSLNENCGIRIEEDAGIVAIGNTARRDRQRLFYWLFVPPVFDVAAIARTTAAILQNAHGLKVMVRDDRLDEGGSKILVKQS